MAGERPELYEAWKIEQQRNMPVFGEPTAWAAEFDPHQSSSNSLHAQTTNPHKLSSMPSVGIHRQLVPVGMYGMSPSPGLYQGNYTNNAVVEGKGKGKGREVDFEAAFAQAAASLSPAQPAASTEDDVVDVTAALDNTRLHPADGEAEDGVEFRQSVSFILMSLQPLMLGSAFGISFRTPTYRHQRTICQSGNLNLIS